MSTNGSRSSGVALVVIAKAPFPGRVKTRLCPPCSLPESALLAEAALRDTLAAVAASGARDRQLALDGEPGRWGSSGLRVLPQRGAGLAERLGHALERAGGPALLIGMDTPQVTAGLLDQAMEALCAPGVDAVLGAARDGGYWAIGMRDPCKEAFAGVPMSTAVTFAAQRRRLEDLGLRYAQLPALRDVDTIADARAVARANPHTRFAGALRWLGQLEGPTASAPEPVAAVC